jgi:hypothetical protein
VLRPAVPQHLLHTIQIGLQRVRPGLTANGGERPAVAAIFRIAWPFNALAQAQASSDRFGIAASDEKLGKRRPSAPA